MNLDSPASRSLELSYSEVSHADLVPSTVQYFVVVIYLFIIKHKRLEEGYEPTKRPTRHTGDVPAPDPHAGKRESARAGKTYTLLWFAWTPLHLHSISAVPAAHWLPNFDHASDRDPSAGRLGHVCARDRCWRYYRPK